MQIDAQTEAWVRLGLVPELRPRHFRQLLGAFGPPRSILAAGRAAVARIVGEPLAGAVFQPVDVQAVERTLAWLAEDGHALVTLADESYPRALLETGDPPPMLYVAGNAALLSRPALAVVGSRNATPQGARNAEDFARALSQAGFTIVSGFAAGIDAAAHRGGLEGVGSTVAVLGTGADVVYPRRNRDLARDLAARGALVSEFPLGTPPVAWNFPRRNRLISALSRGCLVVEAALQSGSLITARLAAEQGREVFAIPGSIHSPVSRGCHELIRQGAKLVETAQHVLEEFGMTLPAHTPEVSGSSDGLLQYIGYDPCGIETIVQRSGLTAEAVSAMLLELELEGRVGSLPGGLYQRTG